MQNSRCGINEDTQTEFNGDDEWQMRNQLPLKPGIAQWGHEL